MTEIGLLADAAAGLGAGLPSADDLKTYVIGLLVATILGALRSWAQQKKLVGTVVAGVDLGRDRLLAALATHPAAARALKANGVDLEALADHLDGAIKNGIQMIAVDAGLEPKLNAVVKATAERSAVDQDGKPVSPARPTPPPLTGGALPALLLFFAPLALIWGCGSVPASHARADAAMYSVAGPYARAGGLDTDTDEAWRILAGVTSTASPGGPNDPALDHGMPRPATGTAGGAK